MSSQPLRRRFEVPLLAWLIVPIAWLVARPYLGIRHDAMLYTAQALHQIWPSIFSQDVFFAHGSQDSYSVFSSVIAWLFEQLGVAAAEAYVPLVFHALLLLAAGWLLRASKVLSDFEVWLGLLALAAFPHLYDGQSIFAFAEPFLTARTVAEPLCLLAMGLLLNRRLLAAGVTVALAAIVHPLITLPVLLVGWICLCVGNRRWIWAACLLPVPVALGFLGVAPFDQLLARYDTLWWAEVLDRNTQVLLGHWPMVGWQTVLFDLALLALASTMLGDYLKTLCRSTILATAALMVFSFIGADLMHNVLITSLQLWRVMWFTHLLALLMLPLVLLRIAICKPLGLMTASAVFLAAASLCWPAGWALGAWAALSLMLHYRKEKVSPAYVKAGTLASMAAVVALGLAVGTFNAEIARGREAVSATSVALAFLTTPAAVIAAALALLWAVNRPKRFRVLAGTALALSAGVAAANWDRRADWQRYLESSLNRPHPFQKFIGERQQVYWHDNVLANWLLLKRPSYYSELQGAGQLFNRGTMEALSSREMEFKGLRLQEELCRIVDTVTGTDVEASCSPTLELAEEICVKQPQLDFMIFDLKLPRGVVDEWTFNPPSGQHPKNYYLYDCNKLRGA